MNRSISIRIADPYEAALLTALVLRAKAHWGYDEAFLQDCESELTITPDYLKNEPAWVAETATGDRVGFCGLSLRAAQPSLDYLYVLPEGMGQGIGQKLVEVALAQAFHMGHETLWIDSDPHAEGFYLKMGAVLVSRTESPVRKGRFLPRLKISTCSRH